MITNSFEAIENNNKRTNSCANHMLLPLLALWALNEKKRKRSIPFVSFDVVSISILSMNFPSILVIINCD